MSISIRKAGFWATQMCVLLAVGGVVWKIRSFLAPEEDPLPQSVTFYPHVAPIVFRSCTPCHQQGQPGPFPLVHYADFHKHAEPVLKVTQSGFMPPWLPDRGVVEFLDERRLSLRELALIRRWVEGGALEGVPVSNPKPALLSEGWQMGTPDLVVTLPKAFLLPADGPDVYRNFVIPIPLETRRFVRAVEFHPGSKVIHHAFLLFDPSRQSRRMDARDETPGFPGLGVAPGVESPGGYFLSWQPGRRPIESIPGMSWSVRPGMDLLLQMHMQPRGSVEEVQPRVGFYFTDQAPTNTPLKISLSSYAIDIPAGATNHPVTDRFVLPSDVFLLGLLPHAHYLAKTVEGAAIFPDGRRQILLQISNWDFNWQSDFRLKQPLLLPKGTQLLMRFTYDNSTNNVRNPTVPPTRVTYGAETRNEMAELWMQVLPRTPQDAEALQSAYQRRVVDDALQFNTRIIAREPENAHAHVQLGKAKFALGQVAEARALFDRAAQLDPSEEEAQYNLGVLLMGDRRYREASQRFARTLFLNPENLGALNNQGLLLLSDGKLDQAESLFREMLRINPSDAIAKENLDLVAKTRFKRGR